jgi:hypothetical protein
MEQQALLAIFFGKYPLAGELFECVMERLRAEFPGLQVLKVGKTMINVGINRTFFYFSLPGKAALKNSALELTLGLNRRIQSPRVLLVSEPHPGRWTHRLLIRSVEDLDEEMLDWLHQAEAFALSKRGPSRLLPGL